MEARIDLTNPDIINIDVTLTMQLCDWKILYSALEKADTRGKSPIWEMRNMLGELIGDLDKQCIVKYSQKTNRTE